MMCKSDLMILSAAGISLVLSVVLWFGLAIPVNKDAGIFVGLWVPSILSLANYFKCRNRG